MSDDYAHHKPPNNFRDDGLQGWTEGDDRFVLYGYQQFDTGTISVGTVNDVEVFVAWDNEEGKAVSLIMPAAAAERVLSMLDRLLKVSGV